MLPRSPEDPDDLLSGIGPTDEELAAIEAEAPVIDAELRLLDAEIALIRLGRHKATELDWQRVRNAEAALAAAWLAYLMGHDVADSAVA